MIEKTDLEQKINALIMKYQIRTTLTLLFLILTLLVINWAMVAYSDYKMSGMNTMNFTICIVIVNSAVILIGDMIKKVLIQVLVKENIM